jgi:transcriptional regulator with XRE-family HTH domain
MGERLKRLRKARRLNQFEVANLLSERGVNVGNTTISRWESDPKARPSPVQIIALADLYGVKPIDLGAIPDELELIARVKETASRVYLPGNRPRPKVIPGQRDTPRSAPIQSPLLAVRG